MPADVAICGRRAGHRCGGWLPGGAASALAASGTHALPLWAAALVLTGYSAAGLAAATRLTLRRDLT
jgi:hypothetical protein